MKRYSEQTLRVPGWYWFIPAYPKLNLPKFNFVDVEAIQGKWLHCKLYAGTYIGPIDIKAIEASVADSVQARPGNA